MNLAGAGEPHAGQQAGDGHPVCAGRDEEPEGALSLLWLSPVMDILFGAGRNEELGRYAAAVWFWCRQGTNSTLECYSIYVAQARHEQVDTEAALAALKRSAQQEVVNLDAEDEEAVRQAFCPLRCRQFHVIMLLCCRELPPCGAEAP